MRKSCAASHDNLFGINPQQEIITRVQAQVDEWVAGGYAGASELSRTLLFYWFGEPHLLADGKTFFQWHPHQRRAVETAIFLYEVCGLRRTEEYAALADRERTAQKATTNSASATPFCCSPRT